MTEAKSNANLQVFAACKAVPEYALKRITGGRMNGKSSINPMWRIEKLTELFGVCGVGWYTELVRLWLEPCADGQVVAFTHINLYIRDVVDGEWSKPITGIGGSKFADKESKGVYYSDECYKMAYTDAISVACKALGFGADVYMDVDDGKYGQQRQAQLPPTPRQAQLSTQPAPRQLPPAQSQVDPYHCSKCGGNVTQAESDYSLKRFGSPLCRGCQ